MNFGKVKIWGLKMRDGEPDTEQELMIAKRQDKLRINIIETEFRSIRRYSAFAGIKR